MVRSHTTSLTPALLLVAACAGEDQDLPPIQPPGAVKVDAVESPTNQNPITLTGRGEAGANLQVRGGKRSVVSMVVGDDGGFSVEVPLKANVENRLLVYQSREGEEGPSVDVIVLHDDVPPDTPVADPITSPTRAEMVTITGRAEAEAELVVTGGDGERRTMVDADGTFSVDVGLMAAVAAITQNDLELTAIDAAGNVSSGATVTVVHNPNLPLDAPEIDPTPPITNRSTITLTGRTEPSLKVIVTGGMLPASATSDAGGGFSVEVELRENAVNRLSVVATLERTGLTSPPRIVTVEQDSVPPDAPALDPVGSPTGAEAVDIAGTTEANAEVTLTGGSADTSTLAGPDGRFAARVSLTLDAINTIEVVAQDSAGNESSAATVAVEQDSTLEVPVDVDPIPSPTIENPLPVSGRAEAGATIEISGGAATATAAVAGDGTFSADIILTPNTTNTLRFKRAGSTVETVVTVVHDDTAPEAPTLDAIASPTNQTNLNIAGTTEPSVNVAVSGGTASASGTADTAGRFSVPVSIAADATTSLSVIATDRAGNASPPVTLSVTHSSTVPDAPIIDDPSPAPTNEVMYTLTGRVSQPGPDVTIRVDGGVGTETGVTDPSTGSFSVDVMLQANASNELHVVSIVGAIESPAAIVTILHDDVAPNAPDLANISVGNASSVGCLARFGVSVTGGAAAVEAFARVRITNLTASNTETAVDAAQDGSFSATIAACDGDRLRITATDAAGNESPPSEVTVTN